MMAMVYIRYICALYVKYIWCPAAGGQGAWCPLNKGTVTFCVVTLYQEEEHHQRLLFFVGVPGAGFFWILFGVETGDW